MSAIDIKVEPDNFEAVHSLSAKSSKTIVRFVNRKICIEALRNRKKMKTSAQSIGFDKSIVYVNENLTDFNNEIAYRCRRLKKSKLIDNTYSMNGIVYIMKIGENKRTKILHIDELKEMFPDFADFQSDSSILLMQ